MNLLPGSFKETGCRDWIGIVASIGCAIHCAVMPFVIAYLPGSGLSIRADESFHKWMFLVCVLIGLSAFLPGWRNHHRLLPLAIGSVGLGMIGFAAFGLGGECCIACSPGDSVTAETSPACCPNGCCEYDETRADPAESESVIIAASFVGSNLSETLVPWITPLGGVLLIGAHLLNRRFGSVCGCCASVPEDP